MAEPHGCCSCPNEPNIDENLLELGAFPPNGLKETITKYCVKYALKERTKLEPYVIFLKN